MKSEVASLPPMPADWCAAVQERRLQTSVLHLHHTQVYHSMQSFAYCMVLTITVPASTPFVSSSLALYSSGNAVCRKKCSCSHTCTALKLEHSILNSTAQLLPSESKASYLRKMRVLTTAQRALGRCERIHSPMHTPANMQSAQQRSRRKRQIGTATETQTCGP